MSAVRSMSEAPLVSAPASPEGGARPSAGALLRATREATGLHIAALAVSLKVPVRKLEALEADRWDELTDPVFVRALASSACRSLRTDPAPILALLPAAPATKLRDAGPLRVSDLASSPASPVLDWLRRFASAPALAVLGILAASIVVYLWPAAELVPSSAESPKQAPRVPGTTETAAATTLAPGAPTVASQERPAAPPPAAGPAPTDAAQTSAPINVPVPIAASSQTLPGGDLPVVSFKARGNSWVEVVDARQTVLLRRTLSAGESATAAGEVPLAVVIGRVDAIEVLVRGQVFDAQAKSKDNVARFEVK
jgi:cytoskeleton protein RodZ